MKFRLYNKAMVFVLAILFIGGNAVSVITSESKRLAVPSECKDTSIAVADKITEIINKINESTVRYYLETLVNEYPFRVTGSETCERAGTFVFDEFEKMGGFLEVSEFNWSGWEHVWKPFYHPKWFSGKNIVATLPGNSLNALTFIFSAHYDCNKDSPGALDDGSGIAALLTVGKVLSNYSFNHTIQFIAYSGEEQGLLGSYAIAKKMYSDRERIVGVINADVIGNNTLKTSQHHSIRTYSTCPARWIIKMMQEINQTYHIGLEVEDVGRYFGHSDDKSFDDYGYGAMQLYNSGNGLEDFYGGPNDTIDLINFTYLTDITKLLAGTLAMLGDMSAKSLYVEIETPEENRIYIIDKRFLALWKGKTVTLGDFTVEASVEEGENTIQKAVFELLEGENEDSPEERQVLANITDTLYPYEWVVKERCFGWNTIRATVYDENGKFSCDEIEIWTIHL